MDFTVDEIGEKAKKIAFQFEKGKFPVETAFYEKKLGGAIVVVKIGYEDYLAIFLSYPEFWGRGKRPEFALDQLLAGEKGAAIVVTLSMQKGGIFA